MVVETLWNEGTKFCRLKRTGIKYKLSNENLRLMTKDKKPSVHIFGAVIHEQAD